MDEQASFHPLNKESIRRGNLIIEWETPEYHHIPKNNNWYWVVGIVAGLIAVLAILLNNILFAIIIVIATFTLMTFASRPPENMIVTVGPKGIRVKNRLYPYNNLKSFSIKEHKHGYVLILEVSKIFLPLTVLPIDDSVDVNILSNYLEAFVPEEDHSMPFVEILAERLGF